MNEEPTIVWQGVRQGGGRPLRIVRHAAREEPKGKRDPVNPHLTVEVCKSSDAMGVNRWTSAIQQEREDALSQALLELLERTDQRRLVAQATLQFSRDELAALRAAESKDE